MSRRACRPALSAPNVCQEPVAIRLWLRDPMTRTVSRRRRPPCPATWLRRRMRLLPHLTPCHPRRRPQSRCPGRRKRHLRRHPRLVSSIPLRQSMQARRPSRTADEARAPAQARRRPPYRCPCRCPRRCRFREFVVSLRIWTSALRWALPKVAADVSGSEHQRHGDSRMQPRIGAPTGDPPSDSSRRLGRRPGPIVVLCASSTSGS